jgi:drug/metabolite transporter (DMT)-like permease
MLITTKHEIKVGILRSNLLTVMILGGLLGLHFIFFISSVKETTILNATVLVNTTPILASIFSVLLLKVKPTKTATLGMIISFLGIVAIAFGDAVGGLTIKLRGDIFAILAALVEAIYLNVGVRLRKKMSAISIMAPLYLAAACVVVTVSVLSSNNLETSLGLFDCIYLFALGGLPTAVAHTLYFSSLSHLKSFETSSMALLEPIGASILGMLLFNEIPSFIFVMGAIFVLSGVFLTVR